MARIVVPPARTLSRSGADGLVQMIEQRTAALRAG